MALNYQQLERFTHAALNNIKFTTATEAETAYAGTLASSALTNGDYNLSFVRDAILNALHTVAKTICETDKHPERTVFVSIVGPIAQSTPGVALEESMGPYGAFRDQGSGFPLEPRSLSDLRRLLDPGVNGIYKMDHACFALASNRVYFVAPSGQMGYEKFTLARPALTVFDSAGNNSVVPASYFNLVVALAVMMVAPKTAPELAAVYGNYVAAELPRIQSGAPYKPAALPAHPEN